MRDFKRLQQDPPQGVNASPNADNIMLWNAVIFGPEDTPWDGGMLRYQLSLCLSDCVRPLQCTDRVWRLQAPSDLQLSFLRSIQIRRQS